MRPFILALLLALSAAIAAAASGKEDEPIAAMLKEMNRDMPVFQQPVVIGDYVVVNVHEETYGMFTGAAAITKDKTTGALLTISYQLVPPDFKKCLVQERTSGKPPARWQASGKDKAIEEARNRCEARTMK